MFQVSAARMSLRVTRAGVEAFWMRAMLHCHPTSPAISQAFAAAAAAAAPNALGYRCGAAASEVMLLRACWHRSGVGLAHRQSAAAGSLRRHFGGGASTSWRSLHVTSSRRQTDEANVHRGGSGVSGGRAEAAAEALLVHWCAGLRGVLNSSAVRAAAGDCPASRRPSALPPAPGPALHSASLSGWPSKRRAHQHSWPAGTILLLVEMRSAAAPPQ